MKFHWWYIPLGLIILLLAAFSALILWMHSMLPWENMVSMTSNFHLELSEKMKDYATGGQRDYTSLPEVLEMEDGTAVTTPEDFSRRREEILGLFEAHVYGAMPNDGFTKGVVPDPDILLIGFNLGHGNSPSLNNSAERQHTLLSPLDCLPAKAGGAVNGGAKQRSFYC